MKKLLVPIAFLAACGSPDGIVTVLSVTSVVPAGGAVSVSRDAAVVVSFSEPLDVETISEDSAILETLAGTPVDVERTWDEDAWALVMTPLEPLDHATDFGLILGEELEGTDSGGLPKPVITTFQTVTSTLGDNTPPIADAGDDLELTVGAVADLDGTASEDPDGDPLTWSWAILDMPEASETQLLDSDSSTPLLVVDTAGTWVIELVVDDGELRSEPAYVQLSVL